MLKKALITGASGTLGSALQAFLTARRIETIPWDRGTTPIDDPDAMKTHIESSGVDTLFHLATASQPTGRDNEGWLVNVEWTAHLARITAQLGVKLVFTSSVMVFTDAAEGPFTADSQSDASAGYGYEKAQAEQRVQAAQPDAVIARLGWQIGDAPGSNNMIDFFERQMQEHGVVRASTRWYPACSFIADTVTSLMGLAMAGKGLYLLDSNEQWTFYEIASALNALHGDRWTIEPTDDFVYDQRMIDTHNPIPPLSRRLEGLPAPAQAG